MDNNKSIPEETKFEAALYKLEEIVSRLSEGKLDLDATVKLYEEGINYLNYCQRKLKETELKIEMVSKNIAKPEDENNG